MMHDSGHILIQIPIPAFCKFLIPIPLIPIPPIYVKSQPILEIPNAFAESGAGYIDKVHAEILCYYHHQFKYPTTPLHKSSIDCTEQIFLCFLYDR